jgi:hypothetical protein
MVAVVQAMKDGCGSMDLIGKTRWAVGADGVTGRDTPHS